MTADILQYVEKHVGNPAVCDHIIAEIVRLRGEVSKWRTRFFDFAAAREEELASIAPAEAKGDVYGVFFTTDDGLTLRISGYVGDTETEVLGHVLARARREGFTGTAQERMAELGWRVEPMFRRIPQPAGGEAVAPYLWLRMKPDGTPDWAEDCVGQDKHFLPSELESEGYWLKPLYDTTPPAAQVQPDRSNWSELDRIEFALRDAGFDLDDAFRIANAATHPAAGDKVRELAAAWRKAGFPWAGHYADQLEAVLQHRGDSRGGEG